MQYTELTRRFDHFLFDMDGTLVLGQTALTGAVDLLAALRRDGKTIHFVTNNTLHPVAEYAQRLCHAGIPAAEEEIFTPLRGLLDHVAARGYKNPFVIASDEVKGALPHGEGGHDVVILSLCRNWDYAQLQTACNLALAGVPFVLAQPDPYCPDPNGNIPDSGALLTLIETTICRKIDNITVIGKPSAALLKPILHDPIRTVFFGDRLKTDMKLADNAGMQGVLVLTGQTTRADVTPGMPYIVLDDLTYISYQ